MRTHRKPKAPAAGNQAALEAGQDFDNAASAFVDSEYSRNGESRQGAAAGWHDMIEETEGLTEQDLVWAKYPNDEKLAEVGVRGIYLGNYVSWEANAQTEKMIEEWGFEPSPEPFERTYRRMSNLDDMHENGVHDYLKYIKFGYGRCTDHVCKDVRAGLMTREQGLELVRRMDPVKSSDLARWLDYVGMSEAEFDRIADTFRDPRVWRMQQGEWTRDEPVAAVPAPRRAGSR